MLGIVGGEGCKLILRDELRFLSKHGTKFSQAPLPPDNGGINISAEVASFLVNVSPL